MKMVQRKSSEVKTMKRYSSKSKTIAIALAISAGLASSSAYSATLYKDDFSSGDFSHAVNGYGWGDARGGAETGKDAKPVVINTFGHNDNTSIKFTFGGGADGTDSWSELRYHLGESQKDVYIQWYAYYPDGTEGLGPKWMQRNSSGPDNNKLLKLWANVYGAGHTVSTGVSTRSDGGGDARFFPVYGTSLTAGTGQWNLPSSSKTLDDSKRGKWIKLQFHMKTATSSNNDGVIQMWLDDELIIDNRDVDLYPSGGIDNFFKNGYIMGWANTGFDQTSYMYIDDFEISDSYIGGNPPSAPVAK